MLTKLKGLFGFLFLALVLVGFKAFAEVVPVPAPVPDTEFWSQLLTFIGGVKGMSMLAVVYGISQLVMVFFKTQMGDLAGIWKLVIVSGLNVLGTVLAQLVTGVPFLVAVLNGSVLAAVSVFINEIIKHFKTATV